MTSEHVFVTTPPQSTVREDGHEDLDRVREIILGADASRQRIRGAEVDRLREILFGAQIEDYERRFVDLRRENERLAADLRAAHERTAEIEKAAQRRIEQIELTLRKLLDDQRRETERQRTRDAQAQQLLSQVRQHEETIVGVGEGLLDLRKAFAASEGEIHTTKSELIDARDQIEQRAQSLRRDLRTAEDSLRAELRRITDRLEHQKTDRKALASMLIEVATRLETGSSVTGLLEGLSGSRE